MYRFTTRPCDVGLFEAASSISVEMWVCGFDSVCHCTEVIGLAGLQFPTEQLESEIRPAVGGFNSKGPLLLGVEPWPENASAFVDIIYTVFQNNGHPFNFCDYSVC